MPYHSARQQRFAHAAAARGEDWAQGYTEHGDAAMRAQRKHPRKGYNRFGVRKADSERDYYRRQSHLLGTIAGTAGVGAAGSGVTGYLEHKGHDPFGFTRPKDFAGPTLSSGGRSRVLGKVSATHFKQLKALGATAAVAGGLGVLAHRRSKVAKELTERQKAGLLTMGIAPVAAGAAYHGGVNAGVLGLAAGHAAGNFKRSNEQVRGVARGTHVLPRGKAGKEMHAWNTSLRQVSGRTLALKTPAAIAAGTTAAAGGVLGYNALRHARRQRVTKGADMHRDYQATNAVGRRLELDTESEVAKANLNPLKVVRRVKASQYENAYRTALHGGPSTSSFGASNRAGKLAGSNERARRSYQEQMIGKPPPPSWYGKADDRYLKGGLLGVGGGALALRGGAELEHRASVRTAAARRVGAAAEQRAGAARTAANAAAGQRGVSGLRATAAAHEAALPGAARKVKAAERFYGGKVRTARNIKVAGVGLAGAGALATVRGLRRSPSAGGYPGY